jgi:hypothetical protein
MEKYTVEEVIETLGAFRAQTYRRAIGFQIADIIERIEMQMDKAKA